MIKERLIFKFLQNIMMFTCALGLFLSNSGLYASSHNCKKSYFDQRILGSKKNTISLDAPKEFQIVPFSDSIKLRFNPVKGATSYKLYYSSNPCPNRSQMKSVTSSIYTISTSKLETDETYYLALASSNSSGIGDISPIHRVRISKDMGLSRDLYFKSFYEEKNDDHALDYKNIEEDLSQLNVGSNLLQQRVSNVKQKSDTRKVGQITGYNQLVKAFLNSTDEYVLQDSYIERGLHTQNWVIKNKLVGHLSFSIFRYELPIEEGKGVIISLHGHGGTPYIMRDQYMGRALAEQGYTVFALYTRQMNGPLAEVELDKQLQRFNLTIMGLRLFEVHLMMKYISTLKIYKKPIGMIGHSGGAGLGSLYTNVTNKIRAYVLDHEPPWTNHKHICEHIPKLKGFDLKTDTSTIIRVFPYNFPNKKNEVISFFNETL